jgi:hypothetical protein
MNRSGGSIFESINARTLTPLQVSETFVPSAHFADLCRRRHSIVLGPRGSGKTTLLKMLQPSALESWKHVDAGNYVNSIDFTGIFVATDISWSKQLSLLGRGVLEPSIAQLLSLACFTTHALKAVVTAFQQRMGIGNSQSIRDIGRVNLVPGTESLIVSEVAKTWHVVGITPSFFSLRQAMTRRLLEIREVASREAVLGSVGQQERLADIPYLHLHFLQAAAYAIEVFEDEAGISAGKWAYSFDELELAPESIQQELVSSIRSTDERFLFKLALNPFTSNSYLLQAPSSPAPGQDFDQISLWYAERRSARAFCEGLWTELANQKGVKDWTPRAVLGGSYFEAPSEESEDERAAYAPGSRWAKRFKALAAKDQTFRAHLAQRGIDLARLHLMDHEVRAAEIRKIAPIVALRDFYRKGDEPDDEPPNSARSRKTVRPYVGADSIFALSEGNPRIFIGLVGVLLDIAIRKGVLPISPSVQADQILETAEKFSAMLRTIPVEPSRSRPSIGVIPLLRTIARYFHADAIKGDFKAEPCGSFGVDARTADDLLVVLGQALNAGAIIYVPDDEGQIIVTSLRGKRFRLSYLLAPLYGFPIRLGRKVALSSILGTSQVVPTDAGPVQMEFIERDENA